MSRPVFAAFLLLSLRNAPALAQQDSIVQHRNDCRFAIQIIATGTPAAHRPWAFGQIDRCGSEGGRALAQALQGLRDVGVRTHDSERLVNAASGFRDRAIYETAMTLADDRGSTVFARVTALRVLLSLINPSLAPGYEDMISESHLFSIDFDPRTVHGEPLPPDYLIAIASRASALWSDITLAADVRNAARHVRSAASYELNRK
jgi:hypothetical protein